MGISADRWICFIGSENFEKNSADHRPRGGRWVQASVIDDEGTSAHFGPISMR
jgi:hypothetical protein